MLILYGAISEDSSDNEDTSEPTNYSLYVRMYSMYVQYVRILNQLNVLYFSNLCFSVGSALCLITLIDILRKNHIRLVKISAVKIRPALILISAGRF